MKKVDIRSVVCPRCNLVASLVDGLCPRCHQLAALPLPARLSHRTITLLRHMGLAGLILVVYAVIFITIFYWLR
jgi:hypothetical protein